MTQACGPEDYTEPKVRDGDLDTFIKHENQATPPSISDGNKLYSGSKHELVPCLESYLPPDVQRNSDISEKADDPELDEELDRPSEVHHENLEELVQGPKVDAIILDGAAVTNMVHPNPQGTFGDYASKRFKSYVSKCLKVCDRVDVVWDMFIDQTA